MAGLKALINPIREAPPSISLIRSAYSPPDETAGRWTNGFTFQPYNNKPAWISDRCDTAPDDSPALPVPTGITPVTTQGGGTLGTVGTPTTYGYRVSAVSANGQTLASAEQTVVVPSQSGSATAKVTVSWTAVTGAAGYNVYGRTPAGELKMTVTPVTTPSFIDTGAITPAGALPAADTSFGPGVYTASPSEVDWIPGIYHHEDVCSAFGYGGHDFVDRAKTQLDLATAKSVEREFWAGDFAQAKGYANLYLIKSGLATDITPTSVPSRKRGFELLEQGLADLGAGAAAQVIGTGALVGGNGQQGMIHCRPSELPDMTGIRKVGNLLMSDRDTIVVAGGGYPNLGPIGNANATPPAGQAWMFATSMVEYRVDDPLWYPDINDPDAIMQAMNRDTNQIEYRVAKFAAAYWSGLVCLACRVTTDA